MDMTLEQFIGVLNTIEEFVDHGTNAHSNGVKNLTTSIGKYLGFSEHKLFHLECGALVHDFGKICIDPLIFRQPTRLTRAQYASVKKHPEFGVEMLQKVHLPPIVIECILYHHEHFDGSGYPHGLVGGSIPIHANIICLTDVWESILSDRPYRRAMKLPRAVEFMHEHKAWYNPTVFEAFTKLYSNGEL